MSYYVDCEYGHVGNFTTAAKAHKWAKARFAEYSVKKTSPKTAIPSHPEWIPEHRPALVFPKRNVDHWKFFFGEYGPKVWAMVPVEHKVWSHEKLCWSDRQETSCHIITKLHMRQVPVSEAKKEGWKIVSNTSEPPTWRQMLDIRFEDGQSMGIKYMDWVLGADFLYEKTRLALESFLRQHLSEYESLDIEGDVENSQPEGIAKSHCKHKQAAPTTLKSVVNEIGRDGKKRILRLSSKKFKSTKSFKRSEATEGKYSIGDHGRQKAYHQCNPMPDKDWQPQKRQWDAVDYSDYHSFSYFQAWNLCLQTLQQLQEVKHAEDWAALVLDEDLIPKLKKVREHLHREKVFTELCEAWKQAEKRSENEEDDDISWRYDVLKRFVTEWLEAKQEAKLYRRKIRKLNRAVLKSVQDAVITHPNYR